MGVEAARRALAAFHGVSPQLLTFATTAPAYLDKTNATAIHSALGLDEGVSAYDMVGSVRSGIGAMRAALDGVRPGRPSMAVLSDIRTGLPGSQDERLGGDGAAAMVFAAEGPLLAELIGHGAATREFLDRWRVPGDGFSRVWEERFGEVAYVPLAEAAIADALKAASIAIDELDHLIVLSSHTRAAATVRKRVDVAPHVIADDRVNAIGFTGAAHLGIAIADVLETASPGDLVALLVLADGAESLVFRVGDLRRANQVGGSVEQQLEGRTASYKDALSWRGFLRKEPPRRPDPERPAAPPSLRNEDWKFGFVGSRCESCGTRHVPPQRVCIRCRAVDRMVTEPLADTRGIVVTFTLDNLAFSAASPVVVAVVDLEGGGRLQCELTDVDPQAVAVGDIVTLTFRRMYTTNDGVHNYFWKARPLRAGEV